MRTRTADERIGIAFPSAIPLGEAFYDAYSAEEWKRIESEPGETPAQEE